MQLMTTAAELFEQEGGEALVFQSRLFIIALI